MRYPNECDNCGKPTNGNKNRKCASCGGEALPDDGLCQGCADKMDLLVELNNGGEAMGRKPAEDIR